jgi:hypothetical protein
MSRRDTPRRFRGPGSTPFMVIRLACLVTGLGLVTPAGAATGGSGAHSGGSAGPLPDSILARVGRTREVTVSRFRVAWKQVQDPQHPDSLTPERAKQFLDLMIDKEALGGRAMAAAYPWPPRDSLSLRIYADQLVMKAVLDSALRETARRRQRSGEPELRRMDLGVAARETAATSLDIRYDAVVCARMALLWKALPNPVSDSSIAAQNRMRSQNPDVPVSDTMLVVARSKVGDYRVSELLQQWRYLDPWSRPRVETPDAIQELVRNGLFERLLRRQVAERRLERRPDVAAEIERRREYIAVSAYVDHEVYATIRPDSAAMMEWYRKHPGDYRLKDRARIARWTLPDRASAGRLAALMLDPVRAESLIARGRRNGADFVQEITAASDSSMFREATRVGAGTVIGPDTLDGAWRVARVMALVDGRPQTFAEAKPQIAKDMIDAIGEERMRALVTRVRKETPVRVNPRAVELMLTAR